MSGVSKKRKGGRRYKEQEYCHDCMHTQHYFDRGAAVWLHKEPVNFSIYQFKYHNQRIFGRNGKKVQEYIVKMETGYYRADSAPLPQITKKRI